MKFYPSIPADAGPDFFEQMEDLEMYNCCIKKCYNNATWLDISVPFEMGYCNDHAASGPKVQVSLRHIKTGEPYLEPEAESMIEKQPKRTITDPDEWNYCPFDEAMKELANFYRAPDLAMETIKEGHTVDTPYAKFRLIKPDRSE